MTTLIDQAKSLAKPSDVFALLRAEREERLEREQRKWEEQHAKAPASTKPSPRPRAHISGDRLQGIVEQCVRTGNFEILLEGRSFAAADFARAMNQAHAKTRHWQALAKALANEIGREGWTDAIHPQSIGYLLPSSSSQGLGPEHYPASPQEMIRMFLPAHAKAVEALAPVADRTLQWQCFLNHELQLLGSGEVTTAYLKEHHPSLAPAVLSAALVFGPSRVEAYRWLRAQGASVRLNDVAHLCRQAIHHGYLDEVLAEVPAEHKELLAEEVLNLISGSLACHGAKAYRARFEPAVRRLLELGARFSTQRHDHLPIFESPSLAREVVGTIASLGGEVIKGNMGALQAALRMSFNTRKPSKANDALAAKLLEIGVRLDPGQQSRLLPEAAAEYQIAVAAYDAKRGPPEDPLLNHRIDESRREAHEHAARARPRR